MKDTNIYPDVADLPPWGTAEAWKWGIAHPDWPWHTEQTRREYEYPTGTFWVDRNWKAAPRREAVQARGEKVSR